jgi:3-dehydroquinate synthetase
VVIGRGALARLAGRIEGRPALVVADANVAATHARAVLENLRAAGLKARLLVSRPGESGKRPEAWIALAAGAVREGVDRSTVIVAVGGGALTDAAGFLAATLLRGLDWIAVPTTLLGMVDAGIGGKTAIDLPQGKNLLGAFHPPLLTLVDPELLSGLPRRDLRAGSAEAFKHALLAGLDPGLPVRLVSGEPDEDDLARAIEVKLDLVREDPFDRGARERLNTGHTLAHALEHLSGYELLHGEAVAYGLAGEAWLASLRGGTAVEACLGFLEWLGPPGLPPLDWQEVRRLVWRDKKATPRGVRWMLPHGWGDIRAADDVTNRELARVVGWLASRMGGQR